jgi:integrase
MKKDVFNHGAGWLAFKEQLTPLYIEGGLTKENSKLYIQYLLDMEKGVNISKSSIKGCRDIKTLNRLRSKVRGVFKLLQNEGIKDISKATEKQLTDFFHKWQVEKNHSVDYAKRFKAFWHWWMTKNRREGKEIKDITEDVSTASGNSTGSSFVWLTKEEFEKFRKYFDEDKQTILLFCFDTIIRAPTELMSVKVENIFEKGEEVWVEIPDDISKTVGRKFNLVYAGKPVIDYIKRHNKKQGDYLFEFSSSMLNQEMQKIAKQLWDGKKSEGGEFYKNITLYDLRHSGAIHFRMLFQKTGQSLDLLRERGGWSDFKMINYYTKRLGLDGHIQKEKLLLQEDKTKMEEELERLKIIVNKLIEGSEKFSKGVKAKIKVKT